MNRTPDAHTSSHSIKRSSFNHILDEFGSSHDLEDLDRPTNKNEVMTIGGVPVLTMMMMMMMMMMMIDDDDDDDDDDD